MSRRHAATGSPSTPRRARYARAALAMTAALGAIVGPVVLPGLATPADATSGQWAGLTYRAGQVCTSGLQTSPLTSWDLGVGTGYITQPIAATGGTAAAYPPLASVGPQSTSEVTASSGSTVANLDPTQIAPLAALLGRYGSSTDDATVAALAHIVLVDASGSDGGATCEDTATESSLDARAAALAGPYTITFTEHPGAVRTNAADRTSVTVLGASGSPVPGARVTVTADSAVLGGSDTTHVTTDASGTATVALTVPTSAATASLTLQASVSVDTALTVVSAQGIGSPADPSGQTVQAIVPSGATTATADQTLTVDNRAHPHLGVSADPQAAVAGAQITPVVAVTGLVGHAATVTTTSTGPLPVTDGTLCSTRTAADFAGRSTKTVTSTVDVVGDGTARAAAWTANSAGCYWITAKVVTTDSTPQASATGTLSHAVLVLDTTAQGRLTRTLVARNGATAVAVRTQHTHGADLTLRTSLAGPVRPSAASTGCDSADYAKAATHDAGTTGVTPVAGSEGAGSTADATFTASATVHVPGLGCTEVQPTLVVHAKGSDASQDLVVPVQLGGGNSVLAIAPTVAASTVRGWGQTGARLDVQVSTAATFQQPAHVQVRLLRTDGSRFGCREANFRGAAAGALGPRVASSADYGVVTAHSAVLTRTGCYQPVAVLTMDADPHITAVSVPTVASVVGVGIAPSADSGPRDTSGGGDPSPWLLVGGLVLFAALLVPSLVLVARYARDARGSSEPLATGGLLAQLAVPRPRPRRPRPG